MFIFRSLSLFLFLVFSLHSYLRLEVRPGPIETDLLSLQEVHERHPHVGGQGRAEEGR